MKSNPDAPQPLRPFLKWAGGKYRLMSRIRELLPEGRKLIEPFVGSGAIFLNTQYPRYLLGDINPDLIHVYEFLKQQPEDFIHDCQRYFTEQENDAEAYYQWRQVFNASVDPWQRACLFVYINRHGYNGLCRYNSKGAINVPFGRYKKPYFPEAEMRAFARKAKHSQFLSADYIEVMNRARRGDVVYCDPPYVPLTDSANFTSYAKQSFGLDDQLQLAVKARHLAQRGVTVVISNHLNGFTQELYEHAEISTFAVQRYISCKADGRTSVDELLALYKAQG